MLTFDVKTSVGLLLLRVNSPVPIEEETAVLIEGVSVLAGETVFEVTTNNGSLASESVPLNVTFKAVVPLAATVALPEPNAVVKADWTNVANEAGVFVAGRLIGPIVTPPKVSEKLPPVIELMPVVNVSVSTSWMLPPRTRVPVLLEVKPPPNVLPELVIEMGAFPPTARPPEPEMAPLMVTPPAPSCVIVLLPKSVTPPLRMTVGAMAVVQAAFWSNKGLLNCTPATTELGWMFAVPRNTAVPVPKAALLANVSVPVTANSELAG